MNIDDLRTLLVIARSGSVTKAAATSRVTQPAATRRIHRLESELGVALIDRRARQYGLTVAGQHLVARLAKLLDALDALRQGLGMDDRARRAFGSALAHEVPFLAARASTPRDFAARSFFVRSSGL